VPAFLGQFQSKKGSKAEEVERLSKEAEEKLNRNPNLDV